MWMRIDNIVPGWRWWWWWWWWWWWLPTCWFFTNLLCALHQKRLYTWHQSFHKSGTPWYSQMASWLHENPIQFDDVWAPRAHRFRKAPHGHYRFQLCLININIYIYICIYVCIYIYIYTYIHICCIYIYI